MTGGALLSLLGSAFKEDREDGENGGFPLLLWQETAPTEPLPPSGGTEEPENPGESGKPGESENPEESGKPEESENPEESKKPEESGDPEKPEESTPGITEETAPPTGDVAPILAGILLLLPLLCAGALGKGKRENGGLFLRRGNPRKKDSVKMR